MKVTGWTYCDNPEYESLLITKYEEEHKVKKLIAEELRKCGYKFTGVYHQNGDYGAPIIDNKYMYSCSCRVWGEIMAMAYPEKISDLDGYGYLTWAWTPSEEMVIPNEAKI